MRLPSNRHSWVGRAIPFRCSFESKSPLGRRRDRKNRGRRSGSEMPSDLDVTRDAWRPSCRQGPPASPPPISSPSFSWRRPRGDFASQLQRAGFAFQPNRGLIYKTFFNVVCLANYLQLHKAVLSKIFYLLFLLHVAQMGELLTVKQKTPTFFYF